MIPLPEPGAFRVNQYLFDQLDAVEAEIRPWLEGTDDTKGPITVPIAVRVALVMAYTRGMADARSSFLNTQPEENHPWPATSFHSLATAPATPN